MKKLLTICLLAYCTQVVAQNKSANIDSLIKGKSFTLVIDRVSDRSNRTAADYQPTAPNVNAALLTMSDRQKLTTAPVVGVGEYANNYARVVESRDAGYVTAFQNVNNKNTLNGNQVIYLVQKQDQMLISKSESPFSLYKIGSAEYYTRDSKNYQVKSFKRNNGNWVLTYHLKEGKKNRTFYIDVKPDGSAVLKDESTAVFYGYIEPAI